MNIQHTVILIPSKFPGVGVEVVVSPGFLPVQKDFSSV